MPRTCTICAHPKRGEIDAAIVARTAYRPIASQFRVGYKSVERHASEHISATVAKSREAKEAAQALDVVTQLKAINAAAVAILAEARRTRDHDIALKAIDRIQRQLELQAKLLGELNEAPTVNVLLANPDWLLLFAAIRHALVRHPDALDAVDAAVAVLAEPSAMRRAS